MKTFFNPYNTIGTQLIEGMNIISKNIKNESTVDDLVEIISKYVLTIYYKDKDSIDKIIEVKSVAYSVINTYINNTFGNSVTYTPEQYSLISLMLQCPNSIPVNNLNDLLKDIEESIVTSGITIPEQKPLLLSVLSGIVINKYWIDKINNPDQWKLFFNDNSAINYANIPFWVESCMQGALIGANASAIGMISPSIDITTVEIISSLIGALSIGSGKIIFNWCPKVNISLGGVYDDVEAMRRQNTGAGYYTESGLNVNYTGDFIKGKRQRYYFN